MDMYIWEENDVRLVGFGNGSVRCDTYSIRAVLIISPSCCFVVVFS